MGSLKKYSGLTTKVKAMRSRLLSASEYELIMECSTVSEVAQILKERDDFIIPRTVCQMRFPAGGALSKRQSLGRRPGRGRKEGFSWITLPILRILPPFLEVAHGNFIRQLHRKRPAL